MARKIKVTLNFDEEDLNQILHSCFLGDKAPEVKDMTEEQFEQFREIMKGTAGAFVREIVETSGDDGDWLSKFLEQFE